MQTLLTHLSNALSGAAPIALIAAALWGVASILLSPCHLAGIPLIIGFMDEQAIRSSKRAFLLSLFFAVGLLLTIALVGVLTATAGRLLGDVGRWGNYFVAALFFAVGLHLLDVIPLSLPSHGRVGEKNKGLLATFLLGLLFGLALGPCTFAFMAPMLAITFTLSGSHTGYGFLLLLAYGMGHCSVIVAAGTGASLVQRYLDWHAASRAAIRIKQACGILVLLGGLWLLYTAP